MILATVYFLVFIWLVYKLPFFKDDKLSFAFLCFILSVKLIGCFAYYWVYYKYYPGTFQSDSSSTLQDASVIYNALPEHVSDFFRIVFGLHTDLESDELYESYFKHIGKWGRDDASSAFFLNDNRTPIRINAVIMLFSFGSYAVHALVMLALSFIGQLLFYKTFKSYFSGKEFWLAAIVFFSPSILFWTSGVLKEPLIFFILGLFIFSYFNLFIHKKYTLKLVFSLVFSVLCFFVLKPYILALILIPLLVYIIIIRFNVRRVLLTYLIGISGVYGFGIGILKIAFNKDVVESIIIRQNDFINLSKGGYFFLNDSNYLRLDFKDNNQFTVIDSAKNICIIKPHAQLMYWKLKQMRDTVYVTDNKDTTEYVLLSQCAPAGSAIQVDRLQRTIGSFAKIAPLSFYNVLCKPFFFDARSFMEIIASVENLLFLLFFVFCFYFISKQPVDKNMLYLCISIVLLSFILIGLTTTVMGAIVRYKAPFIPFLLMIALLFIDSNKIKNFTIIKFFINKV